MCVKNLIFAFTLFALNEAKFFDFTSLNLDQVVSRVRRDADVSTPSPENTEDIVPNFTKFIVKVIEKGANASLVAWQNIYDDKGNIIEVDSVELVLPGKENAASEFSLHDLEDFFDDRSNQHTVLTAFGEFFEREEEGVNFDFFYEVKEAEKNTKLFYYSPSTLYFRPGNGLVTFSKTKTATKEEVDSFVEQLQKQKFILDPLVARLDVDGNVKFSESTIVTPSVLSYVVDAGEIPDKILIEAPKILTNVILTHKWKEIPRLLGEEFNKVFPEYEWRVLVDPGELYIVKDVWIQLALDGFDFYFGRKEIYYVYGVLKRLDSE